MVAWSRSSNHDGIGEHFGAGYWDVIHQIAVNTTYARLVEDLERIIIMMRSFPCSICREHAMLYLSLHPPNLERWLLQYQRGTPPTISPLFIWTWQYHNHVNQNKGKPILSLEAAYQYHSSREWAPLPDSY